MFPTCSRSLKASFQMISPFARRVRRKICLPIRTLLVTPLLSQGVAIGSIHLRRLDVNPFTDQQIALLETFADQAVIAIENARLFQELEDRNDELMKRSRVSRRRWSSRPP